LAYSYSKKVTRCCNAFLPSTSRLRNDPIFCRVGR